MTEKVCRQCDYEAASRVGRLPIDCPRCEASLTTLGHGDA